LLREPLGVSRGEMLAVRLGDIDWTDQLITARGEIAKSGITRHVPIGTTRLKAVLEWQRLDAAGGRKSDSALVISDGSGEPIVTFRRAWVTTVLKAHGVQPRWSKHAGWKGLTSECQEAFQRINLHWHDLRHEYASRLVERGAPLSQVRDLPGHASITTTERYDNQTLAALRASAQRLESGKRFTSVSHSASPNDETAPEAEHEKSQKSLRDEGVSSLAGRQGFEPRYRGPEGAKEAFRFLLDLLENLRVSFVPFRVETGLSLARVSRFFQVMFG
jgi:integrase-like protein